MELRKIYRRVFIVFCMLLFTGCGRQEQKETEIDGLVYEAQELAWQPIKKKDAGDSCLLLKKNQNGFYLLTENDSNKVAVRYLNENWEETENLSFSKESGETIKDFQIDRQEEKLYVLSVVVENYYEQCLFSVYDLQGERLLKKKLGESSQTLWYIFYLAEQGAFVGDLQKLFFYDLQGKLLWEKQKGGNAITEREDAFYLLDTIGSGDGSVMKKIGKEDGKVLEEKKCPAVPILSTFCFFADGEMEEYDFLLYTAKSGLYGYHMEKETADKLIDSASSGFEQGSVQCLCLDNDGEMAALLPDEEGKLCLNRLVPSEVETETLVFAAAGITDALYRNIIQYNREHEDGKMIIRDYSEAENPQQKLLLDIVSGNGPDILDMTSFPVDSLAEKGYLTDLYSLMEAFGKTEKEQFVKPLLKALEMDGKLYAMPTGFSIQCLACGKDVWKDTGEVTIGILEEWMEKREEEEQLLVNETSGGFLSFLLCAGDCKRFFEDQQGEQELEEILRVSGKLPEEPDDGKIQDTEFYSLYFDSLPEDFLTMEKRFGKNNVMLTGVKTGGGNGIYFYPSYNEYHILLSISEDCKQKESAWEFAEYLLTGEIQKNVFSFPVYLPALEDRFENTVAVLEDGKDYAVTEAQKEIFYELLDRADYYQFPCSTQDDLRNIIKEEAGTYFSGDTSLEAAMEKIKSRGTLYLSEKN